MKLVTTFTLICLIGLGIIAFRVVQIRQNERAVPATARGEIGADMPNDETAGLAAGGEASGSTDVPEVPAKPADPEVKQPQLRQPQVEAADVPTSPPPPAQLETLANDRLRTSTAVHWASESGSPAVLRRLAAAREMLAKDPYHPGALRNELAALRALGRRDEAEQTLKRLIEAEPDNVDLRLEYARDLVRQGLWNQAIDPLRQVVQRQPDNLLAWSLLAAAHQTNGHLEEARQSWTHVIELSPQDPAPYANRGQVYVALRDWRAAAADLERSCALDPTQADSALALAQVYSKLGRYEEAKDRVRGVLEHSPRNVRAMNRLAELAWQISRSNPAGGQTALREAVQWWQKSLAIDPNQPAVQARLETATEGGGE